MHQHVGVRAIGDEFQRDFWRIESHRTSRKHHTIPTIHGHGINARADAREMGGADYQTRIVPGQILTFDEIIRENHRLPPFFHLCHHCGIAAVCNFCCVEIDVGAIAG